MTRNRFIRRAAGRFAACYLGFFALATQISGGVLLLPNFSFAGLGTLWPMRQITSWLAVHLFGITAPLVYTGNSGDTAFFWVQTAWLLVLAALVSVIWSAIDEQTHVAKGQWFRLFIRLALAAQMFEYGMAKVIPTQFPPPLLITLVEPVGNLSLSGLLWTTMGAATGYQMFTGWAELVAGVLLIVPRTTLLGATICLVDMIQVFLLNMTYDIGLKQISFHLILMTLFVLAPDFRRLAGVFVLNRRVEPAVEPRVVRSARAGRILFAAQMALGVYLLGTYAYRSYGYWFIDGGGRPKSALYGIWNVDELSVDGQVRPAVLNDYDRRWRRAIFDAPDTLVFQRTDDSFARYGVSIDTGRGSLALTKGGSRTWSAQFTFVQPAPDQLTLDGRIDDHDIHARLRHVELDTLRLPNSTFRWVRPPDTVRGEN